MPYTIDQILEKSDEEISKAFPLEFDKGPISYFTTNEDAKEIIGICERLGPSQNKDAFLGICGGGEVVISAVPFYKIVLGVDISSRQIALGHLKKAIIKQYTWEEWIETERKIGYYLNIKEKEILNHIYEEIKERAIGIIPNRYKRFVEGFFNSGFKNRSFKVNFTLCGGAYRYRRRETKHIEYFASNEGFVEFLGRIGEVPRFILDKYKYNYIRKNINRMKIFEANVYDEALLQLIPEKSISFLYLSNTFDYMPMGMAAREVSGIIRLLKEDGAILGLSLEKEIERSEKEFSKIFRECKKLSVSNSFNGILCTHPRYSKAKTV